MAVVAQVPTPSVTPSSQPIAQQDVHAPTEAFGASVFGQGAEKLGQTADTISNEVTQRALQLQGLQNKAHADDAASGYMVNGYSALDEFREGLPAKIASGADPVALAHQFSVDQESQRQQAAVKLGNPMAQDMFNQDSRRVQAYITSQANSAALTGQKDFIVKSNNAAIQVQQQLIADNYKDPDAIMGAALAIRQHYNAIGLTTGLTPEEEELQTRQAVSKALTPVVLHAGASNAEQAYSMLNDYASKKMLLPEDEERLRGALVNPLKAQGAAQIANGLITPAANAPTTFNIPSPADLTKAFPGATISSGLRTPEHNAEVGGVPNSYHLQGTASNPGAMDIVAPKGQTMSSFAAQLQAAYPDTHVIDEGDHVHIQPSSHATAIATGAASGNPITNLEAQLPSILQKAQDQATAFATSHNLDPDEMKQATVAKVEESYNKVKFAYVGQNAATQSNLLTLIDGGPDGSGPKLSSLDQLMTFPGAIESYKSLTPQDQQALNRQFNANANEATLPRIQNDAYLRGLAQTNPSQFVTSDLSKYDLTRSSSKYFLDLKGKLTAQAQLPATMDKETSAALRNSSAVAAISRMGWTNDSPQYQMFVGALHGSIEAWHQRTGNEGSKMSDQDYDHIVANLFANHGKWTGVPNDPLSQRLTQRYSQLNPGRTINPKTLADSYYYLQGRGNAQQPPQ